MKILLIDNYDSFTFNLYHYLSSLKTKVDVIRNDQITSKEIIKKRYDKIVISPGPGNPNQSGNCIDILKRLFFEYTKKHIKKISLSLFFALLVAGSTSAIAYLLDPAIKKIFIEKDQTLMIIIPLLIIIAFATKGLSLYAAKVLMIGVAEEVRKDMQCDMLGNLISADTALIEGKHTGKFISILANDVNHINNLE